MTAIQLNAELYRARGVIADDAMADILRQGQKDIQQGKGKAVKIEELWK